MSNELNYCTRENIGSVLRELKVTKLRRAVSYQKCRCLCGGVVDDVKGGGVLQGLFLAGGASDPILRWFGYRHSSALAVCFPFPRSVHSELESHVFISPALRRFRDTWQSQQSLHFTRQLTSLTQNIH